MAGGAGIIQKGEFGWAKVFLVEGPETGAAIAATVAKKEDTVIASLSIGT